MVLEQHLLFEEFLVDTKQIPQYSYDYDLQLRLVSVKVKILVFVEFSLVFYPILKLVKLAKLGVLSRYDKRLFLVKKPILIIILLIPKKVIGQYPMDQFQILRNVTNRHLYIEQLFLLLTFAFFIVVIVRVLDDSSVEKLISEDEYFVELKV